MGIRKKLIYIVVLSLSVVLGVTAATVIFKSRSMVREEISRAAKKQAGTLSHAVETFGVIGDMKGLELFLQAMKDQRDLEVHSIRAPGTIKDFRRAKKFRPSGRNREARHGNGKTL